MARLSARGPDAAVGGAPGLHGGLHLALDDRPYALGQLAARWQGVADEIHADVLANGVDERGVFRQHYETDELDASALLIPMLRFLPPEDERVKATVHAIADELMERGLVLRHRTSGDIEGETFLVCSLWLVSAFVEIGERDRAWELCERVLALSSPLQLYAEHIDPDTGRHFGNFPHAFTHLALINAVMHLIEPQLVDKPELSPQQPSR